MRVPVVRLAAIIAAAAALLVTTAMAPAQTVNCEPGHKFNPRDHEQIIAAIVKDAPEVARNVDYRGLTRLNRDTRVLQAAQKAEAIPSAVKQCIGELLKQTADSSLAAREDALRQKDPALMQQLIPLLLIIRSVRTADEVEHAVENAFGKTGRREVDAVLTAAKDIFEQGKKTIYDSKFYANAAERFGSRDVEVIGRRMALKLAQRDVEGAIIGGLWGTFFGPEGTLAGACAGGIRGSALAALQMFGDFWFG